MTIFHFIFIVLIIITLIFIGLASYACLVIGARKEEEWRKSERTSCEHQKNIH
ncbi:MULTISPECIES: hypothetical protein [unclassified Sporolactobacillus]|uniref:hypothetical protein n=1 Tax=unclassified Sporolactobacillus TaxID=2628533 RepID=UPI00236835E0|nr:hypothetical protein [Sporolactobacillus sp. CQH2019]MDD9150425.1 hypothetical protein [Sporolactobacillus sp. CQH2019]